MATTTTPRRTAQALTGFALTDGRAGSAPVVTSLGAKVRGNPSPTAGALVHLAHALRDDDKLLRPSTLRLQHRALVHAVQSEGTGQLAESCLRQAVERPKAGEDADAPVVLLLEVLEQPSVLHSIQSHPRIDMKPSTRALTGVIRW